MVLASRNQKKLAELIEMLQATDIEVVPISDFPEAEEVAETGNTFEENAILKASAARECSGLAAIADDSGLMVDALGGDPGIRSARFAGDEADDEANNQLLLERLAGVPLEERGAAFVCVIAWAPKNRDICCFRGETRGIILYSPRGHGGFGYDPLFLSKDLGVTFAEADSELKNSVSHRGRALASLTGALTSLEKNHD